MVWGIMEFHKMSRERVTNPLSTPTGRRMTGSAFSRWTLHIGPVAVLFIDKGEESEEGEWSRFCGAGRLADLKKNWFFLRNFKVFWSPRLSKLGSMLDLVL